MIRPLEERHRGTTLAWLAVAAIAAGGYVTIVAPGERDVRATLAQAQDFYDLANRNERMLEHRSSLVEARNRVAADLRELGFDNGTGKATVELLRFLDREAVQRNVTFAGLSPDERPTEGSQAQSVTVLLDGAYSDVLTVVAELTRYRVPVGVDSVDLTHSPTDGGSVRAAIHVTLYHGIAALKPRASKENALDAPAVAR